MSGPDRIWAYPSYITGWNSAIAHDRFVLNSTEYVRRDPAVLATLPEIKALIEALKPFSDESLFAGPQHGFVTVTIQHCDTARLALAAIEQAAYDRGVRDAADQFDNGIQLGNPKAAILALLTQGGGRE